MFGQSPQLIQRGPFVNAICTLSNLVVNNLVVKCGIYSEGLHLACSEDNSLCTCLNWAVLHTRPYNVSFSFALLLYNNYIWFLLSPYALIYRTEGMLTAIQREYKGAVKQTICWNICHNLANVKVITNSNFRPIKNYCYMWTSVTFIVIGCKCRGL